MSRAAYLILQNGTDYERNAIRAEKQTTGEHDITTAATMVLSLPILRVTLRR